MDIIQDKIPPQSPETEIAVLGSLLIDKNCIYDAIGILKPEHFYKDSHQKIYQSIYEIHSESKGIDIITVGERLKQNKHLEQIGGQVALAELTSTISNTRNFIFHVDIVVDLYNQRELIKILSEKIEDCFDEGKDSKEILNELESDIYRLSTYQVKREPANISKGLKEAIKSIEKFQNHELVGVPTPFSKLNNITGGWQKQDLVVIGGRPSQGKTQLAIECILAAAESKHPVLFFSCEMSARAISTRFICHNVKIANEDIRKGLSDQDWMEVERQVGILEKLPIIVDETPNIDIIELLSKAKRAKIKYNIELVVIDYLGLIKTDVKFNSENEMIGSITQHLKGLAKELDIPVLLLCQLNRATELHGDKRPSLSNLRSSGNIEQDADIVLFIHNPSVYKDPDYAMEPNVLELIIGKNRNGRIDTIKIRRRETWYELYDHSL